MTGHRFEPTTLREYDIRGVVGDTLAAEDAYALGRAFGTIVNAGLALGDVSDRHSAETLTEMLMGAYYVLMFNWANLDNYPLGEHAQSTACFLTDAMTLSTEERAMMYWF